MNARTAKAALLGAVIGAALPELTILVVDLSDTKGPGRFLWPLAAVGWIVILMPGVILEGRGWVTELFLSTFWGAIGAWTAVRVAKR